MLSHWLFERSASVSSRRWSWTLWVGSTSLGLRLYLCRQDLQWQVTAWHFALLYAGSWLDFGILSVVVFTVITINIIILLHLYTHHMPKNLYRQYFYCVMCMSGVFCISDNDMQTLQLHSLTLYHVTDTAITVNHCTIVQAPFIVSATSLKCTVGSDVPD